MAEKMTINEIPNTNAVAGREQKTCHVATLMASISLIETISIRTGVGLFAITVCQNGRKNDDNSKYKYSGKDRSENVSCRYFHGIHLSH